MKKNIFILLLSLPFLQSFHCGDANDYFDPSIPTVMLETSVNNNAESIRLGDTLRFRLVVPDTLSLISHINGNVTKAVVSSVEACSWLFYYYSIDTVTTRVTRILDNSAYVSEGQLINFGIYMTSTAKPYSATLNIVPKTKGLFYIEFGSQETRLRVNNSIKAGLRVNMNVPDKHWYLYEPYYPGFSAAMVQRNQEGYGWYVFRVI